MSIPRLLSPPAGPSEGVSRKGKQRYIIGRKGTRTRSNRLRESKPKEGFQAGPSTTPNATDLRLLQVWGGASGVLGAISPCPAGCPAVASPTFLVLGYGKEKENGPGEEVGAVECWPRAAIFNWCILSMEILRNFF